MNARQISDDLDATRDSRSYELPELPKFNPDTANLLDRSITILQKVVKLILYTVEILKLDFEICTSFKYDHLKVT